MPMSDFNLGQGEQIVQHIKPMGNLKIYWTLTGTLIVFAVMFAIVPGLFASLLFGGSGGFFSALGAGLLATLLISAVISYISASIRYGKQMYWITNKRVIYKRGFLGYKITSIPFERISDVIISRSFLENIFGFGSLHIQTLAGQMSGPNKMGAEGVLLAIPDPENVQEVIFELSRRKRKEERITF